MSGIELVLAFLAGVVMGGALDRFVLPLLVDAWIDRRAGMGDERVTMPRTAAGPTSTRSARIGAAAALTLVLVVLLVLDVAVPDYDISAGILLPAPGRDLRAPRARGLGILEEREVSTVTALLTNKAYGYPTRGARRRRKPTILACLHQTANAKATAMQERNYANRAGLLGALRHGVHRPRRHDRPGDRPGQVRRLEPGRRRASQHEAPDDRRRGRLGREHERVGARVDRMLGCRDRALHRRPVREPSPTLSPRLARPPVCRSTAAPWSSTPTSTA